MTQYQDGSVDVTNGSTTVQGNGTAFTSNVSAGDYFNVVDHPVAYEIASITDDTTLELAAAYSGPTQTQATYGITVDFSQYREYPLVNPGDYEVVELVKQVTAQIDGEINGLLEGTLAGSARAFSARSNDPADPPQGEGVLWVSDGSGSGANGDLLYKANVGGTVKTITLADFSAN